MTPSHESSIAFGSREHVAFLREQRMRAMVAELEELAARARSHIDVMRAAVQESADWSQPADVYWARTALDDAIVSAGEAERDLQTARGLVRELFG